jgi:hypothetical protein
MIRLLSPVSSCFRTSIQEVLFGLSVSKSGHSSHAEFGPLVPQADPRAV